MSTELDLTSPTDVAQFYNFDSESWLRVNMILSLDGSHVGPSGSSRDLANETDLLVLLTLRAMSDVVLVGAKTAVGEKYRYTQIRPELEFIADQNPPFAIVSESLNLPLSAPIFADPQYQPLIITRKQSSGEWKQKLEQIAEVAKISAIDCGRLTGRIIRDQLIELGLSRIVCEGGPTLMNLLFEDGVVDELCVTTSPTITGIQGLDSGLGGQQVNLKRSAQHQSADYLFSRYLCPKPDLIDVQS